ncbi:peptide chain release factor 2 [Patescibacteria group bacterium]|nr:peptide chain release factor 2 [Patescibacteria group bacterium]
MKEILSQLNELAEKASKLEDVLNIEDKQKEMDKLLVLTKSEDFWNDNEKAARVNKEMADLAEDINNWKDLNDGIKELEELMNLSDAKDVKEDIEEKLKELNNKYNSFEFLTLFNSKYDKNNAILSIYAGAGGDEAQDWAAMLLRMYLRLAEKKNWQVNILDESKGAEAGYKSIVIEIIGKYVYGQLQGESGVHRLVRLSPFDADHARHTSFAMVDILPELNDEEVEVEIDDKDLRIDTFRSSGKGGQGVNKTESAVRIVHLPTGIMVTCQNERSQAQNKETAMKHLKSKLQRLQEVSAEEEKKKLQGEITEAAWGNQIRSYVLHPYKMVKDHRTNFEIKDPDKVLAGDLDEFINDYLHYKRGQ